MHSLWRRANAAAMTHRIAGPHRLPIDKTTPPPLMPLPMLGRDQQWFAITVLPGQEDEVARRVRGLGRRAWFPQRTEWRRVGNKRRRVHRTLFARYVFVGLDPAAWYALRSVHGVESVVGVEGVPLVIPVAPIADLSQRQMAGEFDNTGGRRGATPKWKAVSEPVRILDGPFASFDGWLQEVMPEKHEGKVRVELFGKEHVVKLSLDWLQPVA